MKNLFAFLMFFAISQTFVSCEKDEEPTDPSAATKAILSANLWKLSNTVRVTTAGIVNQTIPTCRQDDLWEYKANGAFAKYPGTAKCSAQDLSVTGTWELVDNNKGLKVTVSNGTYTDEILLVEANKLQLKYVDGTSSLIDTFVPN